MAFTKAVAFSAAQGVETSLNFGEGWGEVVEIESVVHQLSANKTTGETYDAQPAVRIMIQRTDADGKATTEDPIEEMFGCGSLAKFHPGIMTDATDQEPEDQGDQVGAAGNCIVSDGSKMNTKSKWHIFTSHLDKLGFKPAVLDTGFLPDLVGLKGFFTSIPLPKDADRTYKRDPKALVMNKITRFPYEAKGASGGKGKGATAAQAGTAAPKNGKVSNAAAEAAAGGDDDESASIAVQVLLALAGANAGQSVPAAKLSGKLVTLLNVGLPGEGGKKTPVPPKLHKTVGAFFKNVEWLSEKAGELEYGYEDGTLTFPAA